MNTRISYLYRDACNYKVHNQAVIKGEFEPGKEEEILECLSEGRYFIPEQVGLPVERFGSVTEDDHPWCELEEGFATKTDDPATVDVTAEELYNAFCAADGEWDETLSEIYYAVRRFAGIEALSDDELVSELLSRGSVGKDALEKLIYALRAELN